MASGQFEDDHNDELEEQNSEEQFPSVLPVLPMRNVIVFPFMVVPVTVGQPRSQKLVEDAYMGDRIIAIVGMKDPKIKEPSPESLYEVGSIARILRLMKAPDGKLHILVKGIEKMEINEWVSHEPYLSATYDIQHDFSPEAGEVEAEALRVNLVTLFKRMVSLMSYMPDELASSVSRTQEYRQMAYLISSSIRMELTVAQEILELDDVIDKLKRLTEVINRELEVHELGKKIQSDARTEMDKAQRDYFLRQQLKAIQKELGEEGESLIKVDEFREKIQASGMPDEAREEAMRELSRMEKIPEASAEYGVILTYLDWITSLPWDTSTEDNFDIEYAQTVLDEDHYKLVKIKERILEYLAVRKLRHERAQERVHDEDADKDHIRREREGVILCFVGPPGLGKTSLGQSIARALGRKFFRMSLGGMRDEAEIRGHRRTYIGALPGRFVQGPQTCGYKKPGYHVR